MTALEHYTYLESTAKADLARALRRTAATLEAEAKRVEAGERFSDHSVRSDVHELEHAMRAHDKATAASAAAFHALECEVKP